MDAKTEAHALRSAFVGQPDDVLFSRKYMLEVADFIEQHEKYAELGRLAIKAYVCDYEFDDFDCETACDSGCDDYNFCQKRAELLANAMT